MESKKIAPGMSTFLYLSSALCFFGLHCTALRFALLCALLLGLAAVSRLLEKGRPCPVPTVPAFLTGFVYTSWRGWVFAVRLQASESVQGLLSRIPVLSGRSATALWIGAGLMAFAAAWFLGAHLTLLARWGRESGVRDRLRCMLRPLLPGFLVLSGICVAALIPLIRADFNYNDDVQRVFDGGSKWGGFSRFANDFLSSVVHGSVRLTDLSPLPQLLACAVLAFAATLLVRLVTPEDCVKPGISAWLPGLVLCLCPYFMECFSYKMDAPYMALSLLVSIAPFLFWRMGSRPFAAAVFAGTLLMCTTYQAASGVIPMLAVFLTLRLLLDGGSFRDAALFALRTAAAYAAGLIVFRLFLMIPQEHDYVSTSMLPLSRLIPGAAENLIAYYRLILRDFPKWWLVPMGISALSFVLRLSFGAKKPFAAALGLSVAAAVLLGLLLFGVYPFLSQPLTAPRSMYAFGVFLALLCAPGAVLPPKKGAVEKGAALCLCWLFFTFAMLYGNTLSRQEEYTRERAELLLTDLAAIPELQQEEPRVIQLCGSIGYAPSIRADLDTYPLLGRLVPATLGEETTWSWYVFENYYGLREAGLTFSEGASVPEGLPVLSDTLFHTVLGADGFYAAVLK